MWEFIWTIHEFDIFKGHRYDLFMQALNPNISLGSLGSKHDKTPAPPIAIPGEDANCKEKDGFAPGEDLGLRRGAISKRLLLAMLIRVYSTTLRQRLVI